MTHRGARSVRARTLAGALSALTAVALVLAGCAAAVSPAGPESPAPMATPTPTPTADLTAYDWGAITLPASSCDSDATGDITLVDGQGAVTVDAQHSYTVVATLPPDFGDLGGRPAAVLRYSCFLDGANGVGEFPIAVFAAGASAPELVGVLHNTDLGVARSGYWLTHDAVSFVDGQIVLAGKFLTDDDARCCPSGVGWTWIAFVYGRLVPQGAITEGAPPTSLPARGARVEGDLIVYEPAIRVREESDLEYLDDTPDDFRAFIWQQKLDNDGPGSDSVISVSRVRLSGFASGSVTFVPEMGGAAALWVKRDGAWQVLTHLQNTPSCATLKDAEFPADVLGDAPKCLDDSYDEVPYAP